MALVVKQFHLGTTPRPDGAYVEIVARESGFFAWLFALLKLDPVYSLTIYFDKVVHGSSSFHGFRRTILPVQSVSSIYFGTARPWKAALAVFLLFSSFALFAAENGSKATVFVLVMLGVGLAILVFLLNRELLVGFKENTGDDYSLVLKKSVIEGQEITEERLSEISRIFTAILDAHKSALRSGNPSGEARR